MTDLPSYLNKAQSTIEELKLRLVGDDLQKLLDKVENMFMVFIFHCLHKREGGHGQRTVIRNDGGLDRKDDDSLRRVTLAKPKLVEEIGML